MGLISNQFSHILNLVEQLDDISNQAERANVQERSQIDLCSFGCLILKLTYQCEKSSRGLCPLVAGSDMNRVRAPLVNHSRLMPNEFKSKTRTTVGISL